MIIIISAVVLLVISFVMALRSLHELEMPPEVRKLMHRKKTSVGGVILFLQKKIIHYSKS